MPAKTRAQAAASSSSGGGSSNASSGGGSPHVTSSGPLSMDWRAGYFSVTFPNGETKGFYWGSTPK